MVAFDFCCVAGSGFDDIGVERSLDEEMGVGDAALCLFEDTNEFFADCFSFFLGVGDPLERFEKSIGCPFVDEFNTLGSLECLDDLVAFTESHETRVDEHAHQLRSDCFVN